MSELLERIASELRVPAQVIADAEAGLTPELRGALTESIRRRRALCSCDEFTRK